MFNFKDLRERMGKEATAAHKKPKRKRGKRVPKLTPEQFADRRQERAMMERAALLSIAQLSAHTYQVWGGEEPHIVTSTEGWVTCDCRGWKAARHHNCSHVMKYRLTFGDLKK